MAEPQVSILIPNFNNGRASSVNQTTDLIADLLVSLEQTLASDPTPLEIIALDDGSTDDSIATLRNWASKTWSDDSTRAGEPFLRLIEKPHRGVLADVANDLVDASSGRILVRLDGDIVVQTPHWARALVDVFDRAPENLGVIGPLQLSVNGNVHAFGDCVLHPKGYHHLAAGWPPQAITDPVECDHVMGCFYVCKREVHEAVGGYDGSILRGQTIDFGLMARKAGYRCWAIPQVRFVHRHGLRHARANHADTAEGVRHTLDRFKEKWGFDRLLPDLDGVADRYAGTGLLWDARIFGNRDVGRPKITGPDGGPPSMGHTDWGRYAKEDSFRKAADAMVGLVKHSFDAAGIPKKLVHVGCGAGLIPHLLARVGSPDLQVVGVDHEDALIEIAREGSKAGGYPGDQPVFDLLKDGRALPESARGADAWVVSSYFEHHPNPAGLIHAMADASATNAWLLVTASASAPAGGTTTPHPDRRATSKQLHDMLHYSSRWQPISRPEGPSNKPAVALARLSNQN